MDRFITKKLLAWKNHFNRKPLMVRGARQVGKTWSIIEFGKKHFDGVVHVVDLEKHPDWHRLFEGNLLASRIVSELEILLDARIQAGRDLLFFDEIQSCPRAIMALRYFYEEMPELHVIAAGSLLEFAFKSISFPVGRVQFLDMYPMTFAEYLQGIGKTIAAEVVLSGPSPLPETAHNMLLQELRTYMFVGGMPECVRIFAETGRQRDAFAAQVNLVDTYRQDFSKYTPSVDRRCLDAVFITAARNVGNQIKYAHLAEGFSNPTIKKAFDLLCMARVLRRVSAASPAGLPLAAFASPRKFKALMVDIGLMRYLSGMPADAEYAKSDLLAIYRGAMAEQFVGQELLAAGQSELYYWAREKKSSTAEVDYLIEKEGRVYPIEVKSSASGRLKSLHLLLQSYPQCPVGYVLSGASYSELPEQKLIFVPLYFAFAIGGKEKAVFEKQDQH